MVSETTAKIALPRRYSNVHFQLRDLGIACAKVGLFIRPDIPLLSASTYE